MKDEAGLLMKVLLDCIIIFKESIWEELNHT